MPIPALSIQPLEVIETSVNNAGVSDVRDESDREGLRVVVEVKRGFSPELVLNGLYTHTDLQSKYSCNLVALVNQKPHTLALKDFLVHFLDFRFEQWRELGGSY